MLKSSLVFVCIATPAILLAQHCTKKISPQLLHLKVYAWKTFGVLAIIHWGTGIFMGIEHIDAVLRNDGTDIVWFKILASAGLVLIGQQYLGLCVGMRREQKRLMTLQGLRRRESDWTPFPKTNTSTG